MTLPHLIFYGLATFRLALMLSSDGGPYRVFTKLRSKLKKEAKTSPSLRKSDIAKGISCIRCSSVWVSGVVAAYAYYHDELGPGLSSRVDIFLACMALSGLAILVNRWSPSK